MRVYRKLSTKLVGAALVASVLSSCGGGSPDVDTSADTDSVGQASGSSTGGSTVDTDRSSGAGDGSNSDSDEDSSNSGQNTDGQSSQTGNNQNNNSQNNPSDNSQSGNVQNSAGENSGDQTGQNNQNPDTTDSPAAESSSNATRESPSENLQTGALVEVPAGLTVGEPVVTPSDVDPFSKFQLDDAIYTNNVYDGRQLDATNNWKLIFYNGVQDFVRWEVPALIGNNADPCVRPQWVDPVTLSYRLTSRKDSPTERDTFVRAYPAMVIGTMGGRFESWGVECGQTQSILPSAMRHGGSPVYQMETVADATGLPVLAGDLDYDIRVSVKADLEEGSAGNGIANVFMDSYWHNVSDAALLPGEDNSLVNTINGISSDYTEVWNLNIWFDYPRFKGSASQWTGGRKIGSVTLNEGGLFDVYFKIEGSRDGHRPKCRLGGSENCFLYIGLVATDPDAARNGVTVNYTEIGQWMRSPDFRDLFLDGAFETETPSARAYEAWRMIDGEQNDNNPDPAKRGPRFPDKNHVIGGIHLGAELWYNPDAQPASLVFEALGVSVEGKGDFGRYIEY